MDYTDSALSQPAVSTEVPNLLGNSLAFKETSRVIVRVASCDATALVQGETGTGKELAARSMHYLSERRGYPFVPVNCGAIPESLFESEFFGYAKGAFTDAKVSKPGFVAHAEGGTLFLDEVECLSPKGQAVLLRFIQDQSYRPLGGNFQTANVRVIAASNRDLLKMAQAGEFRLDLYYRLALLMLTMPPLRERVGDAELLANHFIGVGSKRFRVPTRTIHPSTLEWFGRYHWPGNIRELENLVYREILLSDTNETLIKVVQPGEGTDMCPAPNRSKEIWENLPYRQAKRIALNEFESRYLKGLLAQVNGNISAAARLAGKERRCFGRLMKKNGIDKSDFCSGMNLE